MIELKRVTQKTDSYFKEILIEFEYKNTLCLYSILTYLETNETSHFIHYKLTNHTNSRFNVKNEITNTDFIKAFNQYFNYQIPLKQ